MKNFTFRKELVEAQDELLRFAYKLTMDIDEANDLLQETSLKALDNEDKYISDTNFRGWMYTCLLYTSIIDDTCCLNFHVPSCCPVTTTIVFF